MKLHIICLFCAAFLRLASCGEELTSQVAIAQASTELPWLSNVRLGSSEIAQWRRFGLEALYIWTQDTSSADAITGVYVVRGRSGHSAVYYNVFQAGARRYSADGEPIARLVQKIKDFNLLISANAIDIGADSLREYAEVLHTLLFPTSLAREFLMRHSRFPRIRVVESDGVLNRLEIVKRDLVADDIEVWDVAVSRTGRIESWAITSRAIAEWTRLQ